MSYSILYLPAATADLNIIFEYVQFHSSPAVKALLDTFEYRIGELKNFPRMEKAVPDYALNAKGYRFLVVENYYIFYIAYEKEKNIIIHRILSAHQDYLQWIQ